MSDRARLVGLSGWIAILAAVSLTVPAAHTVAWGLLGLSSVVAMIAGILRHRPRHRGPWFLLVGAVACLALGDVVAEVLLSRGGTPFPSVADVSYMIMYLLIAAGMLGLYRVGVVRRDVEAVLDALTLTTAAALLSWVLLIDQYVTDPAMSVLAKAISVSYPLGDLVVLATGASLVVSMRSTVALRLLAVGGIGLLGSDCLYAFIQLYGEWRVGTPVDLGWVAFYLCWGLAALHPSMRELTEPKLLPERKEGVSARRLMLPFLSSLVVPAVLAVEVVTTGVQDGVAIAIFSAILSTLVFVRLARVARSQRRSVLRERALRLAGAQLLPSTDVGDVSSVLVRAVGGLLPAAQPYRVVLDLAEPAEAPESRHAVGPPDRTAAEAVVPNGSPLGDTGDRRPTLVYTADLPPTVARDLGAFEVTLRCDVPGQRGQVAGQVYIAAEEPYLVTLQESAQVLADQAGLTLQRVWLNAEIDKRNREAYFRTLVLNAADVILILDADDRIRYASPSAATLFRSADLVGMSLPDLVAEESVPAVSERLARIRAGEGDPGGPVWRVGRPEGEALVEATCRDLRDEPTVAGVVVTLRDVTESRRMQDELYRRATTDALTGLPNQDVFASAVQRAVDESRQVGGRAGVVVVGIDEFRLVNNTMGHRAGDELLVRVGQRLTEAIRGEDPVRRADGTGWLVARLGSDEFATCLAGVRDQAEIDRVVTAMRNCFNEPFVLDHGSVTIRASVGVAMTGGDSDAAELLRQADLALSVAKDAGRNRTMQYEDSLHALVSDRLQMREDLERAVATGAFVLEFQPIVTLPWPGKPGTGTAARTVGFEALIRWQHPRRGTIGPGEFIALAEESGLIVPLGNWVLHHAIRAAASWHVRSDRDGRSDGGPSNSRPSDSGPSDSRLSDGGPYVSVNVSARQLRTTGFPGRILDELTESGLPPARLVLEITESMLAQEMEVTEELSQLRERGVRVAIDDFGTGFSSLSYLRHMPADILKLDKSFAESITNSPEQQEIIGTVTQLAHKLRLEVVAEGIENEQEQAALVASGCTFGQGYVVSRPMGHEDVLRWLRDEPVLVGSNRRGHE
ncbi:MAG: EAL domain-containing protein [Micromonosporaceae bacterium]|nr:EAL domain-containing protein [Micromonosporaceae bacterium]